MLECRTAPWLSVACCMPHATCHMPHATCHCAHRKSHTLHTRHLTWQGQGQAKRRGVLPGLSLCTCTWTLHQPHVAGALRLICAQVLRLRPRLRLRVRVGSELELHTAFWIAPCCICVMCAASMQIPPSSCPRQGLSEINLRRLRASQPLHATFPFAFTCACVLALDLVLVACRPTQTVIQGQDQRTKPTPERSRSV